MDAIQGNVFEAFEAVAARAVSLVSEKDIAVCFFEAFVASFFGGENLWNAENHIGLPFYDFVHPLPDGRTLLLKIVPVGQCLIVSAFFDSDPDKVFTTQIPLADFVPSKREIEAKSIDSDLWFRTAAQVWSKVLDPLTPIKPKERVAPPSVPEPSPLLISGPHISPSPDPLRVDLPSRRPLHSDSFGVGHRDLHGDLPQMPSPFGLGGRRDPGFGSRIGPGHPLFGDPSNPYHHPRSGVPPSRRPPPGARFDPFGPPGFGFSDPDPDNEPFRPDYMYM